MNCESGVIHSWSWNIYSYVLAEVGSAGNG